MATGQRDRLIEHLSRAALRQDGAGLGDGQLLSRFLGHQDADAFAALLRRHGPMVLGVCRRLLGNGADAEDAFQATFLVFVRKAAGIASRESVGGWLYRVAYRTALASRARIARRRAREQTVKDMPHPVVKPEEGWHELLPLLDREVDRLPEKYRLAVVLCDLEGRTRREAARQLRIPEGTLSSRLAKARRTLARRLARHGLALSAGTLAALLAAGPASAAVPAALLHSTTRAAALLAAGPAAAAGVVSAKVAALTEGVMKAMFLAKLKVTTAVLAGVAALGVGTGGLLYQARAQAGPGGAAAQADGARPRRTTEKERRFDPNRPAEAAREQALRAELEATQATLAKLRAELEAARKEAQAQRDRAEELLADARAQRQQAEAQRAAAQAAAERAAAELERARTQEAEARQRAEQVRYVAALQQAEAQRARGPARMKAPQPPPHAASDLDVKRDKITSDYQVRRNALLNELHALEEQHAKALAALEDQRLTQRGRPLQTPPVRTGPGADERLDRILERLDRLERLLERRGLDPDHRLKGS